MEAFEAMQRAAARVGWPREYIRDLEVHDRRWLAQGGDRGLPFGWVIYQDGTVVLSPGDAGVRAAEVVEQDLRSPCWFWWDGADLWPVTGLAEMKALLAKEASRRRDAGEAASHGC